MTERLRIAQVAPLIEPVPPPLYGGTERVVANVTDSLLRAGHEVTLFASGDSETDADLVPGCERALRLADAGDNAMPVYLSMLEEVYNRADEFDVIHSHIDYIAYPFARRSDTPTVTTMHGRLDLENLPLLYREYDDMPLVSISQAQRRPLPDSTRWASNIYHGLPLDQYELNESGGDYLAFLGRISPEKAVDSVIRVAIETGRPLKIAAKVDPVDEKYFETRIEPMLQHSLVDFVGEISEEEKQEFLGNAAALLFLIDWPEPFGLAMIEAMACGTPVIARRRGSVPEVVDEGITGFICENETGAAEAVRQIDALDRSEIRQHFETRFDVDRMGKDYINTYRSLIAEANGYDDRMRDWPRYPESRL